MIPANQHELKRAFNQHRNAAAEKTSQISSNLLLFYAVECGLKSVWLKRNPKISTTDNIPDKTLVSHNLDRLAKELRISSKIIGNAPDFHLSRDGSNLDISKAHEVWRYGVQIKPEDEKKLVEWLEKICNWIEDNINR